MAFARQLLDDGQLAWLLHDRHYGILAHSTAALMKVGEEYRKGRHAGQARMRLKPTSKPTHARYSACSVAYFGAERICGLARECEDTKTTEAAE